MTEILLLNKHVRFLLRHLNIYPEPYSSLDSNRITLLYFAVGGLDILGELDSHLSVRQKQQAIDWIYSLQVPSSSGLTE